MNHPEEQLDSPLDEALREHLRHRLDGQFGRAGAAFRREIVGTPGLRIGRRLLIWGVCAGASLAASVAIVWSAVSHHTASQKQVIAHGEKSAEPGRPVPVEETLQYVTVDEGTVVLENEGPARQLRRSVLQTFEYYDPQQKASIQVTVPQEETVLVGMQTF